MRHSTFYLREFRFEEPERGCYEQTTETMLVFFAVYISVGRFRRNQARSQYDNVELSVLTEDIVLLSGSLG